MKLLVVGGGRFVGRHITEAAVAAGHEVWLANRGRTSTDTFGAAGRLTIDRGPDSPDLSALAGTRWDAVIDVSAYVPRQVEALANVIGPTTARLVFVSTVSVYDPAGLANRTESAPLREPAAHDEPYVGSRYGELKVACEQVATERWGERLVTVRPGVVAGPHDHTDRFTWWTRALTQPRRLPDARHRDMQVTDARDLGAFCALLATTDTNGPLDVTGEPLAMTDFAGEVAAGVGSDRAAPRWTPVEEWDTDLPPLVLDPSWGQDGIFSRTSAAAVAAGFRRRPLATTAADTREWDVARGLPALTAGPPI